MHIDYLGLIVQADGDGGDTAQREGMYAFCRRQPDDYANIISKLEVQPGIWVRHPKQYPAVRDFSRDQTDPNVIAMGAVGLTGPLKRMLYAQLKRGMFYQNLDLPLPSTFGCYIRSLKAWYLYPVLMLLDFFMLWTLVELISKINKPDDVDDNNVIMKFIQSAEVYPTPISAVSRYLYSRWRPTNYGCVGTTYKPVFGALRWYHRKEAGGNPNIADGYRMYIDLYFGGVSRG